MPKYTVEQFHFPSAAEYSACAADDYQRADYTRALELYGYGQTGNPHITAEQVAERFLYRKTERYVANVARDSGEGLAIIGLATWRTNLPGRVARLDTLAVALTHQRDGVGDTLMDAGESMALELGHERVALSSLPDSVGYYARRGYAASRHEGDVVDPSGRIISVALEKIFY